MLSIQRDIGGEFLLFVGHGAFQGCENHHEHNAYESVYLTARVSQNKRGKG